MAKIQDIVRGAEILTVTSVALLALAGCAGTTSASSSSDLPISNSSFEACLDYKTGTPENILPVKCEMEEIFGVPFRYVYGEINENRPHFIEENKPYKHWLQPSPSTEAKRQEIENMFNDMTKYYSQFSGKDCLTIGDIRHFVDYYGDSTQSQIKPPGMLQNPEACLVGNPEVRS